MAAGDFGFVGSAYDAPDPYQDSQRSMNWFVEMSQDSKSKTATALLGCPGLNTVIQFGSNKPLRGAWVLPGGEKAIFVGGSEVYLVTTTVPASQTAIAQFEFGVVGALLTNSGPVSIRDNGAGGYVVIVDGANGYYYRIAGLGSTTIQGTVVNGSTTLTYTGSLNSALIVGSDISGSGIAADTQILSIRANLSQITLSRAATSSVGPTTMTVQLNSFGRFTDEGFLGANRVAFIDGWLIFNRPGTQTFYSTSPVPYALMFDASFFALKDSSSDNLITHQELNRELWLIGERTSEIWFDGGGAQFAFQRIPGAAPPIGCSAVQSLCQMGDSLVWLGKNAQGENIVVRTKSYSWERISNHGVEKAISSYPQIADAIGYAYEEEGHLFYMLTFPTADKTWCFDAASGKWHERGSYDSGLGIFHRHRSSCFVNFQNLRLVGDYATGSVHQMSRNFYTDAGQPLVCIRRCPHIWSAEDRERIFHASLQIEFAPGVGLQTGQGSDPQVMVRWSNDGSDDFGNEHWVGIGKAGRRKNRAIIRRLGQARDRVFEARFSDPTKRDIVGATLVADGSV